MSQTTTSTRTDYSDLEGVSTQFTPIKASRKISPEVMTLAVLIFFLGLAVFFQFLNGAFSAEFSAYPDEPAHYVTSLMLREYIIGPHPVSPMHFAESYYRHYPKVAFGHWPPVFYIVQALWMLVFSATRASVRLEVAFTTALLALSVWKEFRKSFGNTWAFICAALLICIPLVQNSTDEEMAEMLLVLFCFWSSIYFARYLDSGRSSDSILFGIHFSLAVLTKGSGWLLALVPCLAFLLVRRLSYLRQLSFWLGLLPICVLCLPWQLLTLHSAERGWTGGSHPSVSYTLEALAHFLVILISILGPVLSVLVALGILAQVLVPFFSLKRVDSMPAVMLAVIVADWVFHALVPAGVEDRKMIIAVPALLYFLFAGIFWLADRLVFVRSLQSWRRTLVVSCSALVFAFQVLAVPVADHYGYLEAARFVASDQSLRNATFLVSSGSIGEGLFISEVAMREPRPQKTILRATKELAKVDWTGTHYKSFFANPSELLQYLERAHVDAVVLDTYPGQASFTHQKLVEQTIRENPAYFKLLATFKGHPNKSNGEVHVFRLVSPSDPNLSRK